MPEKALEAGCQLQKDLLKLCWKLCLGGGSKWGQQKTLSLPEVGLVLSSPARIPRLRTNPALRRSRKTSAELAVPLPLEKVWKGGLRAAQRLRC